MYKEIQGYEGLYSVDELGDVVSHHRYRGMVDSSLRKRHNSKGYLVVSLFKNGKSKTYRVHRLVAQAFIPNPENKPQINHKNGVKDDNRISNLEWCNGSENILHAYNELGMINGMVGKTGGWKGKTGVEHNCSIQVIQTDKNGNEIARYGSIAEASRITGLCNSSIAKCCKGKRLKSTGGFKWKYAT